MFFFQKIERHPFFSRTLQTALWAFLFLIGTTTNIFAAEGSPPAPIGRFDLQTMFWWLVCAVGSGAALYYAWFFYKWMEVQPEGNADMVRIAGYVREGAKAYLNQQYKIVGIFFAVAAVVLAVISFVFQAQSQLVPLAFLTGGFFSGLAGWFGMRTATLASSRTAEGARNSLNQGLQVAFRSGAVMGLTVVGLGLADICLWFFILHFIAGFDLVSLTVTMLCFGMGASSQALFARVGGGIFTKAADVGADLVGKVEAGIPEDDPRNPAVIADNVGDNVGDVAGMGADLYESYCGSILASAALGVAAFHGVPRMQMMSILLPMVIAAAGIGLSIYGIFLVKTEEGASQRNLLAALARGVNISSLGVAAAAFLLVFLMFVVPSWWSAAELKGAGLPSGFGLMGVFTSVVIGLFAGVLIGKWTEYSTSQEYEPTRRIADQAVTGPATVIIAGIAEGLYSTWAPIVITCIAILLSFGFCTGFDFTSAHSFAFGLYGVGIAAVGMLSTLGITLATDAYGPIADNAGGNAEMSKLDPIVRERTDALDSLGNTTAATGKGFAIGSAALTALALLAAYLEEVRVGFDRWAGGTPAIAAIEKNEEGRINVLKLSSNVLAAPGIDGGTKNTSVLLFPRIGRKADPDYEAIANAKVGGTVSANIGGLIEEGRAVYGSHATIPDFVRFYDITIMNPKVLCGLFLGVMTTFVFAALTMKAVGRAAGSMVEEVRRQFRENSGIMEGTSQPDYASCVAISTSAAQKEMVVPSLLGLLIPIAVGFTLGVGGVLGLLAGGLTGGFAVAVMMANSGGAWDNAKKYIEGGAHGGKGTNAHKATVVGDTVGDPFKDTAGPSLNILIKLMSMVAVVLAGMTVRYSLGF